MIVHAVARLIVRMNEARRHLIASIAQLLAQTGHGLVAKRAALDQEPIAWAALGLKITFTHDEPRHMPEQERAALFRLVPERDSFFDRVAADDLAILVFIGRRCNRKPAIPA